MKVTSLAILFKSAVVGLVVPIDKPGFKRQADPSIDVLAKDKGKLYFGTATDAGKLSGQEEAIIKKDFGQITPENSLKWDATEPSRNSFDFDDADVVVDWVVNNNKSIRGHTLVWYDALPDWVDAIADKEDLKSVIQNHISTVVGRYKGKIRTWDVVNEIWDGDGNWRSSVFYNVLGEDFVRIAFEAARAADPDAKLYINDYNLDDPSWPELSLALTPKVRQWINDGVPIDGIGSQSHLAAGRTSGIQDALQALADTGVSEVAITELDITNAGVDDYWAVTNACLSIEKCVGITTWGVSDKDSWKSSEMPLLFDSSYQPKDAYYSVADALQR
ncbi:structural studies On the mobility in the active site of the Thermoascus Aurantiacus xylanase I [Xylariaceae sp. FL0662B]|nr:structural studies On the mobility in the active site of the Thermoascus Aurantiacus xylanase I [Xylariaceae sp. FL0662B]